MAMTAMRCNDCGDVRWSFMGFVGGRPQRCEICGGEMVLERRLPGHMHAPPKQRTRDLAERRDAHMSAKSGSFGR